LTHVFKQPTLWLNDYQRIRLFIPACDRDVINHGPLTGSLSQLGVSLNTDQFYIQYYVMRNEVIAERHGSQLEQYCHRVPLDCCFLILSSTHERSHFTRPPPIDREYLLHYQIMDRFILGTLYDAQSYVGSILSSRRCKGP
jgi:hypothetical protein